MVHQKSPDPNGVGRFFARQLGSNPSKCRCPVDICLPPAGWRQLIYFSFSPMKKKNANRVLLPAFFEEENACRVLLPAFFEEENASRVLLPAFFEEENACRVLLPAFFEEVTTPHPTVQRRASTAHICLWKHLRSMSCIRRCIQHPAAH